MDLSSFNLILCMIKRDQHACALWNEIDQMYNMPNAFKEKYIMLSHIHSLILIMFISEEIIAKQNTN